jgi:signal transduction histidine kinase
VGLADCALVWLVGVGVPITDCGAGVDAGVGEIDAYIERKVRVVRVIAGVAVVLGGALLDPLRGRLAQLC